MTEEQKHLYDLFCVFADFCERHGLRYYMAGGTLLGAVRHHGFIPWDDDIDVIMPVGDYLSFISVKDELPKDLFLQNEKTDPFYPFLFIELCDTKVNYASSRAHGPKGIYIDIFPVVPSRRPTKMAVLYFNIISVINYVLQVKCGWKVYVPYKHGVAKIGFYVLNRFEADMLRTLRRHLASALFRENTDYYFSPGGGHKGTVEFYPKCWFAESVPMSFEGKEFRAFSGFDEYLRQLYGDYMELPQEQFRKTNHRSTSDQE